MISKHLLCVLVFFVNLNCIPASETYTSIVWDPENPLFSVGDANCPYSYKRLRIHSASKIKFICPNVATVLQTTSDEVSKTNKYENLWLLYNKESFDKCDTTLDINVTEPVLRCDEPTKLQFHSITFQRFAALKDEPAFKKGHFYYIIATSNGKYSNINATSGGHCNDTSKNVAMKIEVYVCNNTEGPDEMCEEGVGELTCPYDTSSSSSKSTPTPSTPHVTMLFTPTATQISTPTTVTTTSSALGTASSTASTPATTATTATEKPNTETIPRKGELGSQKGDSNGDGETAWMATAIIFMVICIAIFIALILYYFFCFGKKKTCQYETRKVQPSPEYGRKNPAFKADNDGFSGHETGSLPDKGTGIVIYNKEVFYDKQDGVEPDKKNPPV